MVNSRHWYLGFAPHSRMERLQAGIEAMYEREEERLQEGLFREYKPHEPHARHERHEQHERHARTEGQMTTETTNQIDLWGGNVRIPIIMVSGPVNSGKTLFGLTIDPNCRRPSSQVAATTLDYDQEGSADSYVGALNFDYKDTRAAVAAGVHMNRVPASPDDPRWLKILKEQPDCNDSPAASMFRAWFLSLINVEPGKYVVGMCDTFTPLQEGLIDWLRRHPEAFGRTVNEYAKASSMFLWPDVKAMLSHILAVECRLRFQTFVLNVHLKNEWAGGSKTGRQVAEGLDVLEKLATVHLELDRSPKAKGKGAPRVPSAILKKERLVRFGASGADDRPILPPRLPECTPDTIRKYIADPPDFAKLSADERLPDQSLSDDQKLLIQQETARNNAEAAQAHLSALEMARQAAAAAVASQAVSQPHGPAVMGTKTTAPATMIQPQQSTEMMGLFRELFATGAAASEWLLEKFSTNDPSTLLASEAESVLIELNRMVSEKRQREAAEKLHASEQAPVNTEPVVTASKDQRECIRELTMQIHGDKAMEVQAAWLRSLGYSAALSLSAAQAAQRINELQGMVADGVPF